MWTHSHQTFECRQSTFKILSKNRIGVNNTFQNDSNTVLIAEMHIKSSSYDHNKVKSMIKK